MMKSIFLLALHHCYSIEQGGILPGDMQQ